MVERNTRLSQKQLLRHESSNLSIGTKEIMIEYYFGRKNQRLHPNLYKRITETYYKASIVKGVFKGWNPCGLQIPNDMKRTIKEKAEEYLFEFCL